MKQVHFPSPQLTALMRTSWKVEKSKSRPNKTHGTFESSCAARPSDLNAWEAAASHGDKQPRTTDDGVDATHVTSPRTSPFCLKPRSGLVRAANARGSILGPRDTVGVCQRGTGTLAFTPNTLDVRAHGPPWEPIIIHEPACTARNERAALREIETNERTFVPVGWKRASYTALHWEDSHRSCCTALVM